MSFVIIKTFLDCVIIEDNMVKFPHVFIKREEKYKPPTNCQSFEHGDKGKVYFNYVQKFNL